LVPTVHVGAAVSVAAATVMQLFSFSYISVPIVHVGVAVSLADATPVAAALAACSKLSACMYGMGLMYTQVPH